MSGPAPRAPHKVVHLDEIEAIPGPGTLTWRPVRFTLGLRAFGANAYTAEQVGDDLVEPHTETTDNPQLAHEELYFVHCGRATFTIDGEVIDAPAGNYVFVPAAGSHRQAVAAEPGTTVLSFGGPPTFEPSAWEWTFRAGAVRPRDPQRARAILDEALEVHPESAAVRYELACWSASQGDRDGAITSLREALERDPSVAGWAGGDEDLAPLRADPRFEALI